MQQHRYVLLLQAKASALFILSESVTKKTYEYKIKSPPAVSKYNLSACIILDCVCCRRLFNWEQDVSY